LPKNNGYDDWMNVGGDFMKYIDSGKKGSSSDFFSYIDTGENYGDYTERPKGKSRKGRPRISNNPNEFGISLQALGDSVMYSEIQGGNAIRHGRAGRKKRLEREDEKYIEKLAPNERRKYLKRKPEGFQQKYLHRETRPTFRKIGEKIKMKYKQRKATNQLKKYYHPKQKQEREEKQEQPQRFKNQRDMR